jgi:hypothetical protein
MPATGVTAYHVVDFGGRLGYPLTEPDWACAEMNARAQMYSMTMKGKRHSGVRVPTPI